MSHLVECKFHGPKAGKVTMKPKRDPFLEVIGIGGDGKLSTSIDSDLYDDEEPTNKGGHTSEEDSEKKSRASKDTDQHRE